MKKIFIGCGVVAGVVLVAGLILTMVTVNFFKKNMPDTDRAEELHEQLLAAHGEAEDFVPPLDGRIDPSRLDAFLAVREQLGGLDEGFIGELYAIMDTEKELEAAKGFGKVKKIVQIAKEGVSLAGGVVAYQSARDSLLLAHGMGVGEYSHIFILGSICYLEHDPPVREVDEDPDDLENAINDARGELRLIFKSQLENGLRELRAMESRSAEQELHLDTLEDVLENRSSRGRMPFQGELPEYMAESLMPVRDRLAFTLASHAEGFLMEMMSIYGFDQGGGEGLNFNFSSD